MCPIMRQLWCRTNSNDKSPPLFYGAHKEVSSKMPSMSVLGVDGNVQGMVSVLYQLSGYAT